MPDQKVFKIEQIPLCLNGTIGAMKADLLMKAILSVSCPTCGAAPGQKCEMNSGQPRNSPHSYRRWYAAEKGLHLDQPSFSLAVLQAKMS